jgi:hypothetical protein
MSTTKKLAGAIALAMSLAACGTTTQRPPPPGIVNFAACEEMKERMYRKQAGINRREAASEAAYIATHDAKIAKANYENLLSEQQELAADIERFKQMCSMN